MVHFSKMASLLGVAILFIGFMRTSNDVVNSAVLNATSGCEVFVVTHGEEHIEFGLQLVQNKTDNFLWVNDSLISFEMGTLVKQSSAIQWTLLDKALKQFGNSLKGFHTVVKTRTVIFSPLEMC